MDAQKMLNEADKIDRELRIERAKATEEVSRLRLEAEKRDKYTAEQRMELLKQAQQIEEDIATKQEESAQKRLDAHRLQMSLGLNTTEALNKEAELEEAVITIQNKKLRMQRLLQTQLTTATNQNIANKNKEIEEEKKKEQELADFKREVREATALTEEEQFALELEKIDEEFAVLQEKALAQFEAEQLTKDELAEIEAQLEFARQQKIQDAKNENAKEGAEKRKEIAEKELNDRVKEMQEEEALRQRKLAGAKNLINGLQSIAELGGKKSRALAIAGIVTDQVSSVSQIISNLGIANAKALAKSPVTAGQPFVALNTIKAVAEIGAGLSASKKAIQNLKSKSTTPATPPSTTTGGGGTPSASTDVATPELAQPSLNFNQGGVNQLAEALGQTEPVQAFVVANDVTTATNQNIANKNKEIEEEKKKEQELADFKREVREATALTEEEQFALELEKIDEEFAVLQEKALAQFEAEQLTKDELAEIEAQLEFARQQKIQDAKNENAKEGAEKRKEIAEKELNDRVKEMQEEEALRQRKLAGAKNLINGLQSIAELGGKKSRALAIAGIVTDQVSSVSQIISNLGIANAKALAKSPVTAGQPFVALNTIKAVAEIGAGLSASKKAIQNLKSKSTTPATPPSTTTGGGGTPSASTDVATPELAQPSLNFNQGGVNQLAEALGQTEPVQAFVVANDVTTAQSMERNIVSSAGI